MPLPATSMRGHLYAARARARSALDSARSASTRSSVNAALGRIAVPAGLNMRPPCPVSSGAKSSGAVLAPYFAGDVEKRPTTHSTAQNAQLFEPPSALARMPVLTRPGLRPKKSTRGEKRRCMDRTRASLPATEFMCLCSWEGLGGEGVG